MKQNQLIRLGFSSCPNDTFIFDAMIHGKIDTEGIEFQLVIEDVEELNRRAFRKDLELTKISFNAFTRLASDYILLNSGAALGENCGPLIITKTPMTMDQLKDKSIAIPGVNTTANLLFSMAFPAHQQKQEMLFSSIEQAVLHGKVEAGLIIHESRFTYKQKGLFRVLDLGEYWESKTGTPTPLGGIIAKRELGIPLLQKLNRVLRRSVQFAFDNPKSGLEFIRQHAQEMSEEVMYQHIALYVNHYSLDLGVNGKMAVNTLFQKSMEAGFIDHIPTSLFVEEF
jgi:1,4-dihydroxy-6-naphthoate synthase